MSDQAQRESRTRIWLDVILRAEGYSRQATAEADPSDTNEIDTFQLPFPENVPMETK
jgi:hypothetical protein